jgi:hypothetical protein
VRDASGELADSFHLLGLKERFLREPEFARAFFDPLLQGVVQLPELLLRLVGLGHIETLDEDARNLMRLIENRFVDEV